MTGSELVGQLKALAELHTSGALTPEEFTAAKARLLGRDVAAEMTKPAGEDQPHQPVRTTESGERRTAVSAPPPPWLDTATPAAAGEAPARTIPPVSSLSPAGARTEPTSRIRAAALTAGGALVTLLAFIAIPVSTVPFYGSLSAADLAGFSSENGALALLWLVPLAALGIAGIGGWQQFSDSIPPAARRRASVIALVLSGTVVVVYLIVLGVVESEMGSGGASGIAGPGFWIALLGTITSGVAASADLASTSGTGQPHSTPPP